MKIKVTFDDGGYVSGWCMVGDNGGEEYDPPEDFDAFLDNCFSFRLEDGKLFHGLRHRACPHRTVGLTGT